MQYYCLVPSRHATGGTVALHTPTDAPAPTPETSLHTLETLFPDGVTPAAWDWLTTPLSEFSEALFTEWVLETTRRQIAPDQPSRFQSVIATDSKAAAKDIARARGGETEYTIATAQSETAVGPYYAGWHPATTPVDLYVAARDYWRQHPAQHGHREYLLPAPVAFDQTLATV